MSERLRLRRNIEPRGRPIDWKLVAIATMVLSFTACAINPSVRTAAADDSALIVGFYDMSDAPFDLTCVRITQGERAGIAYRQSCMTTLKSGLFFLENAPAMQYHVPFFYAGGKLHLLSSDRGDMFTVAPHTIHFLGTFKYRTAQRTLGNALKLTPEEYGLARVDKPDEAVVLRMLADKVQSPQSKQLIRARLIQLAR